MPITKAAMVTKSDLRVTATPIAQKVVASDLNELKRVTDELVDFSERAYGGLYTSAGVLSQSVASGATIVLNQWVAVQPFDGFELENGDQVITIPTTAVYDIEVLLNYNTTSRNEEFFTFCVEADGVIIPGLNTRTQHYRSGASIYSAHLALLVFLQEGTVLRLALEAGSLSQTRTFDLKYASFLVQQVSEELPPPEI